MFYNSVNALMLIKLEKITSETPLISKNKCWLSFHAHVHVSY